MLFSSIKINTCRVILLQELDDVWSEFIRDVDSVKTSVGVLAFAQLSPEDEYRLEASEASLQPCLMQGSCCLAGERILTACGEQGFKLPGCICEETCILVKCRHVQYGA